MKKTSIKLIGVSTHNLKNIDIIINKNSVTSIYGRSGAGKSSLAFSTLYKVCRDEFDALESGYTESQDYEIKDYENIIPAVAISQSNKNNNPRSTLYSYLNIPQILSSLIVEYREKIPEYKFLKINRPASIWSISKYGFFKHYYFPVLFIRNFQYLHFIIYNFY